MKAAGQFAGSADGGCGTRRRVHGQQQLQRDFAEVRELLVQLSRPNGRIDRTAFSGLWSGSELAQKVWRRSAAISKTIKKETLAAAAAACSASGQKEQRKRKNCWYIDKLNMDRKAQAGRLLWHLHRQGWSDWEMRLPPHGWREAPVSAPDHINQSKGWKYCRMCWKMKRIYEQIRRMVKLFEYNRLKLRFQSTQMNGRFNDGWAERFCRRTMPNGDIAVTIAMTAAAADRTSIIWKKPCAKHKRT